MKHPDDTVKVLRFHPLADIFPLMEGEEFDALVEDIKAYGLREKIDLHQGKIVEGRNRYRALQRLGIDPSADPTKYFRKAIYAHTVGGEIASHEQSNDDRVRAYVISKNIHRRHLTVEQKRELIAKLIKAQPEKSDRQVAAVVKASPTTVGTVRAKMEATGDVSKLDTRTDTKGRKQLVIPPTPSRPPERSLGAHAAHPTAL
jgi:ParB-like chromosome segregation protein Spo0J